MLALLSGPVVQYARACESGNCYIVPLIYVITWLGRALERTGGDWGKINNLMAARYLSTKDSSSGPSMLNKTGNSIIIVRRVRKGSMM